MGQSGGFARPWMSDPEKIERCHWTYAPATPEAQQWEGWGTALKPALEPITVARKPFKGTVAANVLEHGTGAINVDGCRVENGDAEALAKNWDRHQSSSTTGTVQYVAQKAIDLRGYAPSGRWPANLIHDGSDDVVGLFPESKGQQGAVTGNEPSSKTDNAFGKFAGRAAFAARNDSGSAARFFYCAKASKAERGKDNTHPTVKPLALMRYLCRLVTPPGGIVLDPFMGSGSTGIAALEEGFVFIGIERDADYFVIAESRIKKALGKGCLR